MKITWKDGVTTLSVAAAVVLERAFFHNWDWPLVDNINWVIGGLAALTAVGLLFSYVLDAVHSVAWSVIAGIFTLSTALFAGLGWYFADSDYVVLLMVNAVVFWIASLVRHMTVSVPMTHSHA